MILGMHRLQVPIETIAQASELTIEEVKKIIEQDKRGGLWTASLRKTQQGLTIHAHQLKNGNKINFLHIN